VDRSIASVTPKTLAFDVSVYPGGMRHKVHEHEELQISLVLRGGVAERVGAITECGHALSVVAKDPGVAHADDFGPADSKLARLTVHSETLSCLVDAPVRASEWRWTHDPAVARPFIRLVQRAEGEGLHKFDFDDPDVTDLLAAFTARPAAEVNGAPPKWLSDTMTELRNTWNPALRVSDIAARSGVHPVYLARCVRRWYGTGLAEELRRLRMLSAAAAIAQTGNTVSRIAHGTGFSDEPHLCRDFRQSLGVTPRRFRGLVGRLS
jgi:AraC family transcriptional regulator